MSAIARRAALMKLSVISFSAAVLPLERLARAQSDPEPVSIKTPSGRKITAVLSLPTVLPAPAVMTIHGSLGLSGWYESLAAAFAKEGFVGLATDLYGGQFTTDPDQADVLRQKAYKDFKGTTELLLSWIDWLKHDRRTNGKVGIVGYSFGAQWALEISMSVPVDATVPYYGVIDASTERLGALHGPVLGHFAERDALLPSGPVKRFEDRMRQAGKSLDLYWYAAEHSFANPEQPSYDKQAAELAWARTIAFLRANLQYSQ
jgi:carboxymethylenebutenolidase